MPGVNARLVVLAGLSGSGTRDDFARASGVESAGPKVPPALRMEGDMLPHKYAAVQDFEKVD